MNERLEIAGRRLQNSVFHLEHALLADRYGALHELNRMIADGARIPLDDITVIRLITAEAALRKLAEGVAMVREDLTQTTNQEAIP